MEKELLGAETKVYNSDRYVLHYAILDQAGTDLSQFRAADVRSHTLERYEVNRVTGRYDTARFIVHTKGVGGMNDIVTCAVVSATFPRSPAPHHELSAL